MTKLEAWKAWCEAAGTADLADEFTLEKSSHGKAFSFAWDEATKAERTAIWNILFEYAGRDDLTDDDQSLIKHLSDLIRARNKT